jgi:hypothetical protein
MQTAESRPTAEPFLITKRSFWIYTLVGAYVVSFVWLTGAIVMVPYVIWLAPLGLLALFNPPANPANAPIHLNAIGVALHFLFWTLYMVGFLSCRRLNHRLLRLIYAIVLSMLLLTIYGCSKYYRMNTANFH